MIEIPKSQAELIRLARGQRTKAEFARELGVDRTCMSRYESEKLGAPTHVLNHCLRAIAARSTVAGSGSGLEAALTLARQTVEALVEASALVKLEASDQSSKT
jgi:hypothetical protein